jgi:hypothetical protein
MILYNENNYLEGIYMEKKIDTIKTENNSKINRFYRYYIRSIPILRRLSWPILIFIVMFIYREKLFSITESFRGLLDRTSDVTFNDFKINIKKSINSESPEYLRKTIQGLSSDAFIFIIRKGDSSGKIETGSTCGSTKEQIFEEQPELLELEQEGLILFFEKPTNDCENEWFWRWTALGTQAYNTIDKILINQYLFNWK